MSKTLQGQEGPHALPTPQPASGLFFLCSFLLMILIPATGFLEIGAEACLNGSLSGSAVFGNCGMSLQQHNHYDLPAQEQISPSELTLTGREIADDAVAAD